MRRGQHLPDVNKFRENLRMCIKIFNRYSYPFSGNPFFGRFRLVPPHVVHRQRLLAVVVSAFGQSVPAVVEVPGVADPESALVVDDAIIIINLRDPV